MNKINIKERTITVTKGEKTKKKIFSTAAKLFREKGYDNVSIVDIVSATNIAKGTFYVHFSSKSDIACSLYQECDDFYNEIYISFDSSMSAKEKLEKMVYAGFEFANSQVGIDLSRIAYLTHLQTENDAFNKNRSYMKIITEILNEGQENGEFNQKYTAEVYTNLLFQHMVGLIYQWCMPGTDFIITEYGWNYMKILLTVLY